MENKYDKIEQYVKGKLKDNELDAFEHDIQSNDELAAEVDFYKKTTHVFKNIRDFERNDTLLSEVDMKLETDDFFKVIETQLKEEKSSTTTQVEGKIVDISKRRHTSRMRILSLAASILVLVVTGSMIFSNTNYSNPALATLEFDSLRTIEDKGNLKSSEDVIQNSLATGLNAIDDQEYSTAIHFFQTIKPTAERYESAQLYLAYALLETGDKATALEIVERLSAQQKNETISYRAEWLALQILLKEGKVDDSFKSRLDSFSKRSGVFKKNSQGLQKQLNTFWRKLVF